MTTEKTTIDCTPTWESLLPMFFAVYEQECKKRGIAAQDAVTNIKTEFRRMSQAADRWNAHCKGMQKAQEDQNDEEAEKSFNRQHPEANP